MVHRTATRPRPPAASCRTMQTIKQYRRANFDTKSERLMRPCCSNHVETQCQLHPWIIFLGHPLQKLPNPTDQQLQRAPQNAGDNTCPSGFPSLALQRVSTQRVHAPSRNATMSILVGNYRISTHTHTLAPVLQTQAWASQSFPPQQPPTETFPTPALATTYLHCNFSHICHPPICCFKKKCKQHNPKTHRTT